MAPKINHQQQLAEKQRRIERQERGLCIDGTAPQISDLSRGGQPLGLTWNPEGIPTFGRTVDRPEHYIRCKACRELYNERKRAQDSARTFTSSLRDRREHGEIVRAPGILAHCNRCAWATYTGDSRNWYCPLPVCKREMSAILREERSDD